MNLKTNNLQQVDLPIQTFSHVLSIFQNKNWPIEDVFDDNVFNNFCCMLSSLDCQQRELILSLTEKFIWVPESQYLVYFSKAFEKFLKEYDFKRGKKIYICPLLPENDFGKDKSSILLLYFIKSRLPIIQRKYSEYNITYCDTPANANLELIKNDYTLCLIDDFIGTGETVEKSMEYFNKQGISLDMTAVISLVGMEFGINKLKDSGYNIYSHITCPKGITDSTENVDYKTKVMETIETQINIKDHYKFGYGHSEALVRMMRTPNNTFPIYWERKKNKHAPFPR